MNIDEWEAIEDDLNEVTREALRESPFSLGDSGRESVTNPPNLRPNRNPGGLSPKMPGSGLNGRSKALLSYNIYVSADRAFEVRQKVENFLQELSNNF